MTADVDNVVTTTWTKVLDMDADAAGKDFFDLGGNSLLAVTLVERIEVALGVPLSIEEFFVNSTLRDLVRQARQAVAARDGEPRDDR